MRFHFTLVLLSACAVSSAQQIRGKVLDSATRQPLPLVTIHLMKPDRTPVSTVISDSLGRYVLWCNTGTYKLLFTSAGYRPLLIELITATGKSSSNDSTASDTYNRQSLNDHVMPRVIPDTYLQPDTNLLTAVTVLGRRPIIEPRADGFVYNAEDDATIAAGTAVDLLRRVPMISMTQDGSPSIRGSLNVRVFIDNRPSSVYASSVPEALQQIPSEEIASVEIITHPSARFDAEGTDAVINIITRKRRYDGYNGSLRTNLSDRNQDLSGTFKWRSGNWITNIDLKLYRSVYEGGSKLLRSASKQETAARLEQDRDRNWRQEIAIPALNITRIIDSQNSVNFHYRFRDHFLSENVVQKTKTFTNNSHSDSFTRVIPTRLWNAAHTFSSAWTGHSRNKKSEYNLLGFILSHKGTDDYDLDQLRGHIIDFREKSRGQVSNREFYLQGDFVQSITSLSKLEAGFKSTWRTSRTQYLVDIFDMPSDKFLQDAYRSARFHLQRDIHAAYTSYQLAIKKWQVRAGIRFEQTRMFIGFKDTALQVPDFLNWLPHVLARHSFNDQHSITYSYTTRIERPFTFYLNPYINYVDSFSINYGNPNLAPEVTHAHTLEYNYNKHPLFASASLAYRNTKNSIEEYRIIRPDKVTESTYRNIGRADNWSLSFAFRYNPSRKFNLGNTVTTQYVYFNSPSLNLQSSGFIWQNSFNVSYRFDKGFTLESYVTFESGLIDLQSKQSHYLFYNLLLTKSLLSETLNITFRMDGIFDRWWYRTWEISNASFYQATTYRFVNRLFRLAISWKLGKQDLRAPAIRRAESSDQ